MGVGEAVLHASGFLLPSAPRVTAAEAVPAAA